MTTQSERVPHPVAAVLSSGRAKAAVVVVAALSVYVPYLLTTRNFFGNRLTGDQLLGIGMTQVNFALITIIAAMALNFLIGYGYLISIGDAALMGIGTVAAAVLGTQAGLPLPVVLLGAIVVGGAFGFVAGLPVLRVRGLYLLLSTLALHYIVIWLMVRYQLRYFGVAGIRMAPVDIFGWSVNSPLRWYGVLLVTTVAVGMWLYSVSRGREGRALRATKGHEQAAASLGIKVGLVRLKAFTTYGAVLGLAGALYGYQLNFPNSESYGLGIAIGHVAIIIIGGLGSMTGTVVAAFAWSLLPTVIATVGRTIRHQIPVIGPFVYESRFHLSQLLLGLTIILFLLFWPGGIAAALRPLFAPRSRKPVLDGEGDTDD